MDEIEKIDNINSKADKLYKQITGIILELPDFETIETARIVELTMINLAAVMLSCNNDSVENKIKQLDTFCNAVRKLVMKKIGN